MALSSPRAFPPYGPRGTGPAANGQPAPPGSPRASASSVASSAAAASEGCASARWSSTVPGWPADSDLASSSSAPAAAAAVFSSLVVTRPLYPIAEATTRPRPDQREGPRLKPALRTPMLGP